MKNAVLLFLLITTLLYAEPEEVTSNLVLESESFELDHESEYGITNSYSFLIAEHQIHADRCLVFYYGTKVGFVIEDYTSDNGFGPDTEQYGMIFRANMGMNYDLKESQMLSFEGSHSQDELHHQIESQVRIGYQYKF